MIATIAIYFCIKIYISLYIEFLVFLVCNISKAVRRRRGENPGRKEARKQGRKETRKKERKE